MWYLRHTAARLATHRRYHKYTWLKYVPSRKGKNWSHLETDKHTHTHTHTQAQNRLYHNNTHVGFLFVIVFLMYLLDWENERAL